MQCANGNVLVLAVRCLRNGKKNFLLFIWLIFSPFHFHFSFYANSFAWPTLREIQFLPIVRQCLRVQQEATQEWQPHLLAALPASVCVRH